MDDVSVLILVLGLIVVIGILARKVGPLQSAVAEMETHVKTVTDPTLASLLNTLNQMNTAVSTSSASVQGLKDLVTNVGQNLGPIMPGIKDMSVQLEKLTSIDKEVEETQKVINDLYFALGGPQSKGKMGEEAFRNIMAHLIKAGQVKANQTIGEGRVEYAMVFDGGKMLPIDCKMPSTKEVLRLQDQDLSPEEKSELEREVKKNVRAQIPDVQKYIRSDVTLPMAVMAVPDSVMEKANELVPEAIERNVILLGYSQVPQVIGYFMRIHKFYDIKDSIEALQGKISWSLQELAKLDEKFFRKHFSVTNMQDGVNTVEEILSGVKARLTSDSNPKSLPVTSAESLDKFQSRIQ